MLVHKIAALSVAALLSCTPLLAADVEVKGLTLQAALDNGTFQYRPLPGVKIKALRGGPILRMPAHSGQNGDYHFSVPEGSPFSVVFYLDAETVPVLQNLAGASGIHHEISVGLLTIKQYQALADARKLPALDKNLQAILDQLPPDEEITGLLKQMIASVR